MDNIKIIYVSVLPRKRAERANDYVKWQQFKGIHWRKTSIFVCTKMSPRAGRTRGFLQKEKPLLSRSLIPFLLGPNIHIFSRSDDWIRNPSVLRLESLSACQWEFLRMRLRPGTRTVIPIPPFLPETFLICSQSRSKEFEGGNEQNFLRKISRRGNSLRLEF
jgi:hypothetical protein